MENMIWIYNACRWILGVIFIYAGATKLMAPEIFAVLIHAYGIVPETLLLPVAIGLPLLEVVAGIGLVFDIRGSVSLVGGLLVMFMVILGYAIWLGLDVDCGCFGPDDPEAEAFHGLRTALIRDLVMMAGVVFIITCRRYGSIRPISGMTAVNQIFNRRKK